ncbi:conjugal transfer protein TraN, partial [Salmonella enterica subsp. enterica serovar Kentucky]
TGNWLQNCNVETSKKTVTTHYPDYKEFYCNSPKQDNFSSCTITRDFSVPVYISGGNGDMSMCGDNCVRIWFGRRDDNYWSDGVFDNELTLKFHPDAKLASAKIVNAEWDDHMRVTLDGTQIFAHIDGAYRESDYPAPKGSWELKKSWKLDKVYDVTEKVRKSVYEEPDREVTMASRVWVGGG